MKGFGRYWRQSPVKRLIRDLGISILVSFVALAAITGLVNSYRHDQDARRRAQETRASLIAGCERSNAFRREVRDVVMSVRELNGYIITVFDNIIRDSQVGENGVTQSEIDQARRERANFVRLQEKLHSPALQDCEKLYSEKLYSRN